MTCIGPRWPLKMLDDSADVPKTKWIGWWFDSWPWNILFTWQTILLFDVTYYLDLHNAKLIIIDLLFYQVRL